MPRKSREFTSQNTYSVYASQQTVKRLDGKGIVIGTSKKIVSKLEDLTEDQLSKLHRLLYGESGVKAHRKTNILAFCGLEQENETFEKDKIRITKNLQKKQQSERDQLKDVFHLKSAEIDDIVAFIVDPVRPENDEELEFKDEILENIINQIDEEKGEEMEQLDVSGDDGDLYDHDLYDDEDAYVTKKPKRKSTRSSSKSKKCAK